jgi:hypothetical protein
VTKNLRRWRTKRGAGLVQRVATHDCRQCTLFGAIPNVSEFLWKLMTWRILSNILCGIYQNNASLISHVMFWADFKR